MCKQCDDSLVAGATAANLLAKAAQTLYSMNDQKNSAILANAAGSLFKLEAEVKVAGDAGTASSVNAGKGNPEETRANSQAEPSDEAVERARKAMNDSLPKGIQIGEDGVLYINDVALGRAVLMRR